MLSEQMCYISLYGQNVNKILGKNVRMLYGSSYMFSYLYLIMNKYYCYCCYNKKIFWFKLNNLVTITRNIIEGRENVFSQSASAMSDGILHEHTTI